MSTATDDGDTEVFAINKGIGLSASIIYPSPYNNKVKVLYHLTIPRATMCLQPRKKQKISHKCKIYGKMNFQTAQIAPFGTEIA